MPYETDYITYDITHQMVEEFMLKANETVAWHLDQENKNFTYRIHDVPAEENLRDFAALAAAFGFKISDRPTPQDLQKLFEEAGESTYANYLASCYIRRMRLGRLFCRKYWALWPEPHPLLPFHKPHQALCRFVVHRILFGESDDFEYLQKVSQQML